MNQMLQTSLPLASDNPFSSEQECIDHLNAHAHHNSYAAEVPDQLRRDGTLSHTAGSIALSSTTSRYGASRPETAYQSDSGPGSISTSPSSNASSALAYSYSSFSPTVATTYSSHYPIANNYNNFPCAYGNMSSTRRMSSLTDASSTAMLPPTRSPGLGSSVTPAMGISARDNYTTATSGLHRHPHTLSPRHSDVSRYNTLPDTPRSVLPTAMPLPTYNGYQTGNSYATHSQTETPPFDIQETAVTIICEGSPVSPNIDAKIEKGFFFSGDRVWTCYRRNYFAVNVSFSFSPWVSGGRLYIDHGNGKQSEQIQSMAVSLAAAVDGATGKSIELIQHTPKRDKGPQLPMKKELLAPMPPGKNHDHGGYGTNSFHQSSTIPGPQLPLQNDTDSSQQYSPTSHASSSYQHGFERIQFKSATANNGKRRAQQQYYHLIVELWANVQNPRDNEPKWVKVAARSSHPVVVRGRSPSHYSNEGPHNAGASRGAGGSGIGGSGHHSLGSNGRPSYSSYSNGLSSSSATGMGGSIYRGNACSLDPSPVGSHSVSSTSSLSGGIAEGIDQHMVNDDDAKMNDASQQYQYYPVTMCESLHPRNEYALPLPERRIKDEYSGPTTAITGSWQVGGCGRFQGIATSRGYYPDVHAHAGY